MSVVAPHGRRAAHGGQPNGAPDRRGLSLLAAGHFVVDMCVGGIPALIPLFTAAFVLSDFESAMILGISTFASSAIQPVFGLLADRRAAPWLLWGGVAVAAAGFALAGLAGGYLVLLACILASGIGVAAYHPEAARLANRLAGDRKNLGMAWFMTGGNLGFASGPLVVALAIPFAAEQATLAFIVPGVIVGVVLLAQVGRLTVPVAPRAQTLAIEGGSGRGFGLMVALTSMRTWTQFGMLAFVPLVLVQDRGWSEEGAGLAVFAFSGAGVLGTIAGASFADRVGGRRMLWRSMPLTAPLVAGFLLTDGPVSVAMIAAAGFVTMSSMSVTVVMGQAYMPHRPALAAGVMIGFASIGSAPPGLALLGGISELAGRDAALWTVAAFPLVGAAMAALLPSPRTRVPAHMAGP